MITSLSHHVEANVLDQKDECLHVAAVRILVEEIDTLLEVPPNMDFSGTYVYIYTHIILFTLAIFIRTTMQITTTHKSHLTQLGR